MCERILAQNCQKFDNFNLEFSMSHHNARYQSYKNAPQVLKQIFVRFIRPPHRRRTHKIIVSVKIHFSQLIAKKRHDSRVFSGKIEIFGNLTGIKHLTNSMSRQRLMCSPNSWLRAKSINNCGSFQYLVVLSSFGCFLLGSW